MSVAMESYAPYLRQVSGNAWISERFPDAGRFNLDGPVSGVGWPNVAFRATSATVAYPQHLSPLSIKCAFGGQEVYEVENHRFAVDDRTYLVLNGGESLSSTIQSRVPVESVCLFFEYGFAAEVFRGIAAPADKLLDDPAGVPLPLPLFRQELRRHDRMLSPIMRRIRSALYDRRNSPGWLEEQFHFALERLFLKRGLRKGMEEVPDRGGGRTEIYRRLHRAKDYIDSNFRQKLTLKQMAGEAYLSPHHFLRLFKKTIGKTPHQYVVWRRLGAAKNLLIKTDDPITKICLDVGFESLGSFSYLFRRRAGVSPSRFRCLNR